jgi:DNA adenine methylase
MIMRYPGSKDRITSQILDRLPRDMQDVLGHGGELIACNHGSWEYREPFVGAGAMVCRILTHLPPEHSTIWLNDLDYGVVCLWISIRDRIDELCEMIRPYTPRVEDYYRFKESDDSRDMDAVETGFRKLVLHQSSFGGLGKMSGGPLGGKRQEKAEYPVDCRWNPVKVCDKLRDLHLRLRRFNQVKITCRDFAECFGPGRRHVFLYCDPPYYVKGPALYKHGMTEADHDRLAECCRKTEHRWAVSYDDVPAIRAKYTGFSIVMIENIDDNRRRRRAGGEGRPLKYTMAQAKPQQARRKNHEILILDGRSTDAR